MVTVAHVHRGAGVGLLHLLTLVIWLPALVVWRLLDKQPRTPQRWLVVIAAWSSFLAGMVHVVVTPEHWHESPLYGVFFLAVSVAQFGFAVLVAWRPNAPLLLAGGIGQLTVIGIWLLTRTIGIPLGPEAGTVEAVGLLDSICVAAEMLGALACLAAMRRTASNDASRIRRAALS